MSCEKPAIWLQECCAEHAARKPGAVDRSATPATSAVRPRRGFLEERHREEEEEEEEKEDEEERHSPHHVLFDFRDEAEEIRIGVGSRSNHVAVQFFVFFGS